MRGDPGRIARPAPPKAARWVVLTLGAAKASVEEAVGSGQGQGAETAVEEARRKQREANCATARSNLDVIDRNARIRIEENGEQRYLSPEEIAEKRAEFERIAEENCGPEEQ